MSSILVSIEDVTTAVNGINTVFTVNNPYISNSVKVYLNGHLVRKLDLDGWSETSSLLGQVTLSEAPQIGDRVQIFYSYVVTGNATPSIEQVVKLTGLLSTTNNMNGALDKNPIFIGNLDSNNVLSGFVHLNKNIVYGTITNVPSLSGIVHCKE